ncbi:MAG: hypothetical protein MUF07_13780 [Steroidobacteraceae bacterium]|nr:hypothetical protein [Steroidobacteraceae bacterium]
MLAREGRIRLEVAMRPEDPPLVHGPWHLRDKKRLQTVVEVEGGGSCVLDVHDSWEVDEGDLAAHDLYFKRSLSPETLLMPGGHKLRTLGLLNDVRPDFLDMIELRNELGAARSAPARLQKLLRWAVLSVGARLDLGSRPTLSRMSSPPTPGQPAGVLLMAGLWDPAPVPTWAAGKREEWESINQMRIECIRALRREFGNRFHGGIRPSAYARQRAPDLMLPSEKAAGQRAFVRHARERPVCVTSTGLHGSNGWRLAEFVALSRAIVSEPLRYTVPGPFAAGTHYLPFTSPEECVAQVARLFDDPAARDAMAQRNWEYFGTWQRPERLALRVIALTHAIGRGDPG